MFNANTSVPSGMFRKGHFTRQAITFIPQVKCKNKMKRVGRVTAMHDVKVKERTLRMGEFKEE